MTVMPSERVETALARFEHRFGGLPLPTPANHTPTYCRECDEMTHTVCGDGESMTCPVCGRVKGLLELGTESPAAWQEMNNADTQTHEDFTP